MTSSSNNAHKDLHTMHFLFKFLDGIFVIQNFNLSSLVLSAARGLINHILFESERLSGRKFSSS